MKRFVKNCIYWLGLFLYYVVIILSVGSLAGAILFAIIGMLFSEHSILMLLKKGVWAGFRYAGVWAGGVAIVLCFLKAGRKGKMIHGR